MRVLSTWLFTIMRDNNRTDRRASQRPMIQSAMAPSIFKPASVAKVVTVCRKAVLSIFDVL